MYPRQYGFLRFFRLKKRSRQYGFLRFFRLKMHPRQYGFLRFFRLKKPAREFTEESRHFCAFQQDMCSDEFSTRVCLPSLCQASYNSLSFPTGLYIHGDIYFVCAAPTLPLHCQAPYILLSFPTAGLYIHARQFFYTHPGIRIAIAKLRQQTSKSIIMLTCNSNSTD
jgi:hypothetical protein